MPDPIPEPIQEKATPQQLIERLNQIRERYRYGMITPTQFKDILAVFQFVDEAGHLWAPGAASNHWYRWDRTQWTQAEPPGSLSLAHAGLSDTPAWLTTTAPAQPATGGSRCSQCGIDLPDEAVFCPECGSKRAAPRPSGLQCPACGASHDNPAVKFCMICGARLGAGAGTALAAPPPPAEPPPRVCRNPSCGKPVPAGKKFCSACGTTFV